MNHGFLELTGVEDYTLSFRLQTQIKKNTFQTAVKTKIEEAT